MPRTIDFLQLTAKLPYPPNVKGELATVHATLIDQVLDSFTNKYTEKMLIVNAINSITYMYINRDTAPYGWNKKDPIHTYRQIDDDILRDSLGDLYISTKDIDWTTVPIAEPQVEDVKIADVPMESSDVSDTVLAQSNVSRPVLNFERPKPSVSSVSHTNPISRVVIQTDKSDLYIQPPVVPRFDSSHPYMSGLIDGVPYVVYPSYPLIPTKQNEISMTTDVNRMSESDLKRLYPNCLIRTRAACMYEPCGELLLDERLGLILPIEGYTKTQLIDNLVRYPHIFRLLKSVNGSLDSFYSTIEIGGELHKISDIWHTLPEAGIIPYTKEFVKEYVVRRYLLERDIKGMEHKYPLYGTLDPFLTLFTSPDDYISMGYRDIVGMARDCVIARVNYKKSRNPVVRRLADA